MPIRLGIDHASKGHRFVKAMTIEVTADKVKVPEVAGVSVAGARRFDVPDTAKLVELVIRIASPTSKLATDLLLVRQSFTVSSTSGAPTLVPASGGFQPRLSPAASSGAATKPGGVVRLELDVHFLDVTEYWLAVAPGFRLTTTHGTRIRLLELTSGSPVCWPVFVPPKVASTTTDAGVLMFLRPNHGGPAYTNTDDVNPAMLHSAGRYLEDQGGSTATGLGPFGLGSSGDFPEYGHGCGFERQLVDAGKQVILVWPMNQAGNFGDAISARMPALLKSVVTALWSSQVIGAGSSKVAVSRVGVGGYSLGGRAALDCFEHNRDQIDELFLFDPGSFTPSLAFAAPFDAWLKAKPGRKLRMMGGGYQHTRLLVFAAALKSPDATCWPPTADAWFTDPSYQRGLSDAGTPLRFTAVGSPAPPNSPSDTTGIFFVPPYTPGAGAKLVLRGLPAPGAAADRTVACSMEEAASIAAVHVIFNANFAKKVDAKTFGTVVTQITEDPDPAREKPRIFATRHEWTVFGGMDFGAGYRGFLQHALELSGY